MKKFSQQEPRRRRKRAFLQSAEESDRFQPEKKGSSSRREEEKEKKFLFFFFSETFFYSRHFSPDTNFSESLLLLRMYVKVVPSIALQTSAGSKILVERANGLHDKTQNPFCRTKSAHSRKKSEKEIDFRSPRLTFFLPIRKSIFGL